MMTLGEFLRRERETKGVTLEQVASNTKIALYLLHALEADQYSELPAKPFLRGFVLSYCRFIGLNGRETLAGYESFINQRCVEKIHKEVGEGTHFFDHRNNETRSRLILFFSIFGFVLLGGVFIVFVKPRLHQSSQLDRLKAMHLNKDLPVAPTALFQEEPKEIVVQAPVENKPENKKENKKEAGQNQKDPLDSGLNLGRSEIRHKIVLKTLADIWVRYRVDERPVRKFVIRQGKSLYLRARTGLVLQVSNSKSIILSYNGQAQDPADELIQFFPSHYAKIDNQAAKWGPLPLTSDPSKKILENIEKLSTH